MKDKHKIFKDELSLTTLRMKTVSTVMNDGAQSHECERSLYCPDHNVQTNDEHWTMTLETHKYAAAAGHFAL